MDTEDPYPLITLATVTYNAAGTLQRTLDSVAAQTYPHIEHLIVDGCSNDGTMELIHRYVEQNADAAIPHEINLIKEPDRGLYDAMNKALAAAKGHYIVFLNAGDTLHTPHTVEQLVQSVEWPEEPDKAPAILYGETDIVDSQGRFLRHRRLQAPDKLSSHSFADGMLVCHQSFYVRTDLAREEHYDLRYRFSADYDWCIRLMRKAERRRLPMHHTRLILTDYLHEGLTTRHHRASLLERLRIMARHFGWGEALRRHAWFVVRSILKP